MLIYSMGVSVDGFIADREGAFGWTVPGEEQFRFHIAQVGELGGYLCGRRLYETMLPWETDPSMRGDELGAAFADVWCAIPKVVFSRTLDSVEGNARLAEASVGEEAAAALDATDKDEREFTPGDLACPPAMAGALFVLFRRWIVLDVPQHGLVGGASFAAGLRDDGHRHVERFDAVRQITAQPLGGSLGKRGDDHVVEAAVGEGVLDGLEGVGAAVATLDVDRQPAGWSARRASERCDGFVEGPVVRVLGRDGGAQEHERRRLLDRATPDLGKQERRRRCAIRDDERATLLYGFHPGVPSESASTAHRLTGALAGQADPSPAR